MQFSVPVNNAVVTVNNAVYNYTPFQIQQFNEVAKRPGFQFHVTHEHQTLPKPRKPGYFCMLWFENNVLHSQRVGQKRLLGEVNSA